MNKKKSNNHLIANFAKYIVDTFCGYFDGKPLSVGDRKIDEDQQTAVKRNIKNFRDNRFFWLVGGDVDQKVKPEMKFLEKPNADGTQENLLNRLEQDIFQLSMVANFNDEDFKSSSGIALQYKLLNMRNMAKTVERQISKSLKERYKLYFSFAKNISQSLADEWKNIEIKFYENLPVDVLSLAQSLNALGVEITDETALKLAGIDNVEQELERLKEENKDEINDDEKKKLIAYE